MKIGKRGRVYLLLLGWGKYLPRMPIFLSGFSTNLKHIWKSIWLGLLDADDLNAITWTYYMSKSGFETEDFNIDQGFWPWEADAVRKHFIDSKHVLVAGAGGGREVIALVRLGYKVTAFDFSPNLTLACRSNLEKASCSAIVLDAPPDGLPAELGIYDALLIGRGFYHHIPTRKRRVTFLSACRAKLEIGAPVLLSDFFTRKDDSRFYLYTQAIANSFRRLRCGSESVELGDSLSNCMMHAFTFDEIGQELSEAGIATEICAVSPFSEASYLGHALGRAI